MRRARDGSWLERAWLVACLALAVAALVGAGCCGTRARNLVYGSRQAAMADCLDAEAGPDAGTHAEETVEQVRERLRRDKEARARAEEERVRKEQVWDEIRRGEGTGEGGR